MIIKNNLPLYKTETNEKLTKKEEKEYQKIKEEIIQLKINDKNLNVETKEIKELMIEKSINSQKIIDKLTNDLKGYGKIDSLLKDDELEEIMIIGKNKPVYVYHRKKGMMITEINLSEIETKQIINKIANYVQRKIDKETPILDARLPNGSRVNATIPPITADGSTITIRKFKKEQLTILDLIKSNSLSPHLAAFLWINIDGLNVRPSNIIISGGTGSGKTTTLNTLSSFIPSDERIITIEDVLELQIPQEHVIRTETRPPNIEGKGEINMDILLKNSLRQRPDRIIVGEVRSKEAITLFGALNTGHSGMGTLHANSTQETITRLINPPMNVPSIMINSIDFIVMQNRIFHPTQGIIRRVTEVAEVVGMEMNKVQLNKIYQYDYSEDKLEYTAISSKALNEMASMKGISIKEITKEIKDRESYLIENSENRRNIYETKKILNDYSY
ncbi:MAG: ATPase, T2SS/T4P/T4SS family [Methanosphaera sp.]|uniref:CpaF family protein n=1 Tax=Methanosphaera sp. TaxID=2666342 RepID=UPI002E79317B|nr:ATPase, T2SS/T4P/T4SS family [Methanosphaera sp.]MEE1117663.1 ATPase, T2SS/T4P/T4SS family [Methanosphaera sp.]MEE3323929.1 ATPase, T2SS/T4P/T4SS family [Methanosphaera sp.]